MPGLRELQADFAAALLQDRETPIHAAIVDGRFPDGRRLQVYRNNVSASLTGALSAVYPVVTRLVGTGFFGYAADQYLRQYPVRSANLHDVGHALGDFLQDFPAAAGHPYLADVARLEWAWHQAFHGPEHAPLDPASLASVPAARQPDLRFSLHPTAGLLASIYPVFSIWQIHQTDGEDDHRVDLDGGGEQGLLLRPHTHVEVLPLARGEFTLLHSLARGDSLATACDLAFHQDPQLDLGGTLQKHLQLASLVAFRVGEPDIQADAAG